jgi:hypothetical protein
MKLPLLKKFAWLGYLPVYDRKAIEEYSHISVELP